MNQDLTSEAGQISPADEANLPAPGESLAGHRRHAVQMIGASAFGMLAAIGLHEPAVTAAANADKKRRKKGANAEKKKAKQGPTGPTGPAGPTTGPT